MDKELDELLDEEIRNEIEGLSDFESGSEEKLKAIKGIAELYKLKIEEDKSQVDAVDKEERRKTEDSIKSVELENDKKDRWIKVCIAGAELILPLIFYAVWMRRGLKFEESGTFTSTTFRGLFNRFRPTK